MRTLIIPLFVLCTYILFGQTITDVTFHVVDSKEGKITINIDEDDEFKVTVYNTMTLHYTKKGEKEREYECGAKKNYLTNMSYMLDGEFHEFDLVEGTSPRNVGSKTKYSLLLEKVYESDNIELYFSPMFLFKQYLPQKDNTVDSVSYVTRNNYLAYGEETLSKHNGTLGSLSGRLSYAACKCSIGPRVKACEETIRNNFADSRKPMSEEQMIEVIKFWESNCNIKK